MLYYRLSGINVDVTCNDPLLKFVDIVLKVMVIKIGVDIDCIDGFVDILPAEFSACQGIVDHQQETKWFHFDALENPTGKDPMT